MQINPLRPQQTNETTFPDAVLNASPSRDVFIAGGNLYKILPDEDARRFGTGFGGRAHVIVWPDGTKQPSRNLRHRGATDQADTAMLFFTPFWRARTVWNGRNYVTTGVEEFVRQAPLHIVKRYQTLGLEAPVAILGWRVEPADTTSKRGGLLRNRYGTLRAKIWLSRSRRAVRTAINCVVCTRCFHLRSKHWEIGDDITGPVDWGCHHARVNATGKLHHCDC